MNGLVNLDEPRWDQSSFVGRAKHFFVTTNPLNVLATDDELDAAKRKVHEYRSGFHPDMSEDEIWRAKQLVDSAFHPDTGEKNFILGRMSFQVPGNMLITGCMMTFYRSTPAVVFWQVRWSLFVTCGSRCGIFRQHSMQLMVYFPLAWLCVVCSIVYEPDVQLGRELHEP